MLTRAAEHGTRAAIRNIGAYAGQLFAAEVVLPALKVERGISRIQALVDNWIHWSSKLSGGCIFVSASTEFSELQGRVRDYLLKQQKMWQDSLRRIAQSAIKAGEFRTDSDCDQFAYDFYSFLLGFHYYDRLLKDPQIGDRKNTALHQLLNTYRNPAD